MSKNKTWSPPGWPWELDLLSLVFVGVALIVPYIYFQMSSEDEITMALREQRHTLWAIGIVLLFILQIIIGGASLELISTPILHLVAPTLFALLAYYRSFTALQEANLTQVINGSVFQYFLVSIAAIALTAVMARIRTLRYLSHYRNVEWEIVQKAPYDSTYWSLITEFEPLVYPPRYYRACKDGILIESWFFIMAIPFTAFQSLSAAAGMRHTTNGRYIASSAKSLIRIELLDNAEPLFISPADRQQFLAYCAMHVARLRPTSTTARAPSHGTHSGTARGTHAGTAKETQAGTARGTRAGTARATHSGTARATHAGTAHKTNTNTARKTTFNGAHKTGAGSESASAAERPRGPSTSETA